MSPTASAPRGLIEIEVKAHIRRIERPRWRRGCECASSPLEVVAPPVPRLFPGTLFGTSFWARFLFEHCACLRPLCRVAAWYADQGLPVSPGTLANSLKRFVPLFDPLYEAILAHQNRTVVRHADETGWRVQEFRDNGRSSRAWLWTSVSRDAVYFHIDPSRSAEVAKTLFGDTACTVFVVCDRYSAYKALARELAGKVILCWCWAHQRRDFIECAAGQEALTHWCEGWIERVAAIYRLNDERLNHYDPLSNAGHGPSTRRSASSGRRSSACSRTPRRNWPACRTRTVGQSRCARCSTHRKGLCVFVDHPQVPMDNNAGERALRGPVIGRRLSFGSDSGGRRAVHRRHVLRHRHALDERHRRAALAGGMVEGLREERWQTAARPVPVAALDDERGAQAQVHDAGMTGAIECRYYGRDFTADEMALLRVLIAADPQPTRAALSREFCRRLGWLKPDGGLKDMMAKVTMLAMHRDGVIVLPPPRGRQGRPKPIVFGPDTEPPLFPAPTALDEVRPLDFRTVVRDTREGKLWNEFVARYHYLGYKPLVGAQMRYAVHDPRRLAARHARLLHRRLEARPARQVHRMDARAAREEPAPGGRQPPLP